MRTIGSMILAATVALAACGGDDGGSTGPGNGGNPTTFRADVTGDVQTSVRGAALFGTRTDETGTLFGVEMAEAGAGESVIQIIRIGGQVPAVGTYQIADALNGNPGEGDFVAMAFDSDQGQPVAIFVGSSGTLKVTSSSTNAFKGTFSFDAQGGLFNDPENTLSINVTGSFYATPAPAGIRFNSIRSR